MNPWIEVLKTLGTLGFATIVAAVLTFLGIRKQLKATKPTVDAGADRERADAAITDVRRLRELVAAAYEDADRANTRADVLEGRLTMKDQELDTLRGGYRQVLDVNDRLRTMALQQARWIAAHADPDDTPPPSPVMPELGAS